MKQIKKKRERRLKVIQLEIKRKNKGTKEIQIIIRIYFMIQNSSHT